MRHAACLKMIHRAVLAALLQLSSLQLLAAEALPLIIEQEPNDTPEQALSFTAPANLAGSMLGRDQDAFLWRISDADALKRWTLHLTGIPDALTGVSIIRVRWGPDPNVPDGQGDDVVIGYDKLLTLGIRDGARPVIRNNIILPPGDLVVGFFRGGQSQSFSPMAMAEMLSDLASSYAASDTAEGQVERDAYLERDAYRLTITPDATNYGVIDKPHQTQSDAAKLRPGNGYNSIAAGPSWYQFEISEAQSASIWTIRGSTMIERALAAKLLDADQNPVASAQSDALGQYEIPNLTLAAGRYFVVLDDNLEPDQESVVGKQAVRSIFVEATGKTTDRVEAESNDNWASANRISIDQTITGAVDKSGENDYYRFSLDEPKSFTLSLNATTGTTMNFCLLRAAGQQRQCRTAVPPVVLPRLHLEAGTHGLQVSRAAETTPYTITSTPHEPGNEREELEPNDVIEDASIVGGKGLIKGSTNAADKDFYTFLITGAPQLWRLQAIGTDLFELSYHPQHASSRHTVRSSLNAKRLRLDNMYLLPGRHTFSVSGRDATNYVLRALPLGPPKPEQEREPNNSRNDAHTLPLDGKAEAILAESSDRDYFRFHIAARQTVDMIITSPPDAQLSAQLYWDGAAIKSYNAPDRRRSDKADLGFAGRRLLSRGKRTNAKRCRIHSSCDHPQNRY